MIRTSEQKLNKNLKSRYWSRTFVRTCHLPIFSPLGEGFSCEWTDIGEEVNARGKGFTNV